MVAATARTLLRIKSESLTDVRKRPQNGGLTDVRKTNP